MISTQHPDLQLITDDAMLRTRLATVLSSAIRRQLWITFLDADGRETGVILPCEDYPLRPDDRIETRDGVRSAAVVLADGFARIMGEFEFASIIAVWERRGGDAVRAAERRWAAAFGAALREAGVAVRGQFLLHDHGLRHLSPDDLVDIR